LCRARQFKLTGRLRSQGLIGYGILSSSLPSNVTRGRVAELADALDLGSSVAIRGGSSPLSPTTLEMPPERAVFFLGKYSDCEYKIISNLAGYKSLRT
jgi:hypothetical protein